MTKSGSHKNNPVGRTYSESEERHNFQAILGVIGMLISSLFWDRSRLLDN